MADKLSCDSCIHYKACEMWCKHSNDLANSLDAYQIEFPLSAISPEHLCEHYKPAADVVEVVRCKDCCFYKSDTDYCRENNKGYCVFDSVIKPKNHFCGYGDRKGEG